MRFIPIISGLIDNAGVQVFQKTDHDLILTVPRNLDGSQLPQTYEGLLRFTCNNPSLAPIPDIRLSGPLHSTPPPSPTDKPSLTTPSPTVPVSTSIVAALGALLAAFVGGLILNLMPCVLPVLSLKVLGMVEQARQSKTSSLLHGLVFTLGVLVTFWSLAGLLLVLQHAGNHLGWGFQLQNPKIVVLLAALFFLMALNLFGVFETGVSLTAVQVGGASGLAQSFFSGLLATVVATPCTAPFMGSALGFAFSQPAWVAFLVFTFLGLGMAAPYLILSASPGLLRFVPKPGAWMETFKQFLGFPLLATVIWLLWVFGHQTGSDSIISVLLGFLSMGLGAWIYGKYNTLIQPSGTRLVATILGLALFIAGLGISVPPNKVSADNGVTVTWEKFDPVRLQKLHSEGTPVFVDFTATWCLSCQVNKRVALLQDNVETAFHNKGVVLMEADWTNQDAKISQALGEFGRNSVPLYLLYGKDPSQPPQILPEILTPEIVLKALDGL